MEPLTEKRANEIYDILVEKLDVDDRDADRSHFVHCQSSDVVDEWRLMSILGFGGKFRRRDYSPSSEYYVDCYREDNTAERQKLIDETNDLLKELK